MVSINKVINVDFNISTKSSPIGSYRTVVYIIGNSFTGKSLQVNQLNDNKKTYTYKLCKSYADVESASISNETSSYSANTVLCSAANFFNNGGAQLLLVKSEEVANVGTTADFKAEFDNIMKALHELKVNDADFTNEDDFLFVCVSRAVEAAYGATKMTAVLDAAEESKSPYTYRILLTTEKKPVSWPTYIKGKSYSAGVKYCTKSITSGATEYSLVDAALLIGAYYSQVNLNGSETIKDYCYTPEKLVDNTDVLAINNFNNGIENVSDDDYDALVNANANFIDMIGSSVVNFGGNLLNGVSIHTDFGACAAENDVTYAVLNTMLKKQYLTAAGLNKIISVISASLTRYKSNGYLELGALYTGETITRNYNGIQFTIIKNNSSISQGYYVTAIPMASISDDDKEKRKFTPVYVILQTAYGARVIEIAGEVR